MRAFKFTPLLKSMIWGGNRIASYKGIAVDRSDIGESWELSMSLIHISEPTRP